MLATRRHTSLQQTVDRQWPFSGFTITCSVYGIPGKSRVILLHKAQNYGNTKSEIELNW